MDTSHISVKNLREKTIRGRNTKCIGDAVRFWKTATRTYVRVCARSIGQIVQNNLQNTKKKTLSSQHSLRVFDLYVGCELINFFSRKLSNADVCVVSPVDCHNGYIIAFIMRISRYVELYCLRAIKLPVCSVNSFRASLSLCLPTLLQLIHEKKRTILYFFHMKELIYQYFI